MMYVPIVFSFHLVDSLMAVPWNDTLPCPRLMHFRSLKNNRWTFLSICRLICAHPFTSNIFDSLASIG